ncbi:MAG: hypothetical protein AB7T63_11230 [Planctomycetota bacterium]
MHVRTWLRTPWSLAVVAALAWGAPAFAGESPTTPSPEPETLWDLLVEKYDANRDGVISKTEYTRGEAAFARCDTNKDGVLTSADGLGRPPMPRGPRMGGPGGPPPRGPGGPDMEAPRCPQCGCVLPPPPGPRGPEGRGGGQGRGDGRGGGRHGRPGGPGGPRPGNPPPPPPPDEPAPDENA